MPFCFNLIIGSVHQNITQKPHANMPYEIMVTAKFNSRNNEYVSSFFLEIHFKMSSSNLHVFYF